MSSYRVSRQERTSRESIGELLRRLREEAELPLWKVANEAEMDQTHLSRIENGDRLPTDEQLAALGAFFKVSVKPLKAQCLAERMRNDYGGSPDFAAATAILNEEAGEYPVKRRPTAVSKRPVRVNNTRKRK